MRSSSDGSPLAVDTFMQEGQKEFAATEERLLALPRAYSDCALRFALAIPVLPSSRLFWR
jgi:hypothetical protein